MVRRLQAANARSAQTTQLHYMTCCCNVSIGKFAEEGVYTRRLCCYAVALLPIASGSSAQPGHELSCHIETAASCWLPTVGWLEIFQQSCVSKGPHRRCSRMAKLVMDKVVRPIVDHLELAWCMVSIVAFGCYDELRSRRQRRNHAKAEHKKREALGYHICTHCHEPATRGSHFLRRDRPSKVSGMDSSD